MDLHAWLPNQLHFSMHELNALSPTLIFFIYLWEVCCCRDMLCSTYILLFFSTCFCCHLTLFCSILVFQVWIEGVLPKKFGAQIRSTCAVKSYPKGVLGDGLVGAHPLGCKIFCIFLCRINSGEKL